MSTSDRMTRSDLPSERDVVNGQFALAFSWTVGLALIAMGFSAFITLGTAFEEDQEFVKAKLTEFSNSYLGMGLLAILIGPFLPAMRRTLIRYNQRRHVNSIDSHGVLAYAPKRNDVFVIVIEGVGTHGSGNKPEDADAIANKSVKELIDSKTIIRSARFYSGSGVKDLLKI